MSAWENYHLEYSPYPLSGQATLTANPYFEAGTVSPWTAENGATVAASNAQAHEGSWSMLVTPDGVTSTPQAQSEAIQVMAGVSYTLSGWLRASLAVTRVLGVFWYDSSGTLLSSNTISTGMSANTWTQFGPTTFTAPDQAISARVKSNGAGVVSTPWWVDEAVLSADVSAIPLAWVDITAYALNPGETQSPINIQGGVPISGGSAQYATMAASLDNTDHRLLFGSSSCLSGWRSGRRIRCYETIGARRFDLFSGYIVEPETTDYAERGVSQHMMVTAVDRLGWLSTSRQFVSTCAEHIRHQGGTALKGFWPLNDASGSATARQVAQTGSEASMYLEGVVAGSTATPLASLVVFGAVTPPAGDDANFVQGNPIINGGTEIQNRLVNRVLTPISMTSNQYVSLVGWFYLTANPITATVLLLRDTNFTHAVEFDYSGGNWTASFQNATGSTTLTGPPARLNTWDFLAARINNSTGAVEFWANGGVYSGSLPGASTGTVEQVATSWASTGQGTGHIQIYADDGTQWTRTKFLAQQAMALNGLANQYTGERVSTLAQYAGVPTAELGLIDRGTSIMQRASLAGRDPLSVMRLAETTEQGRLRTNGQGLIVFEPRTKRYAS